MILSAELYQELLYNVYFTLPYFRHSFITELLGAECLEK